VGTIIGMLLNDSGRVSAQRPPAAGPPPGTQPLTAVAHDATLTGDGTAEAPLGVVSAGGGGLPGVSGHWEGTITITSTQCSNFGTNPLEANLIQLPSGDVTGSAKVGATGVPHVVSSSVFGKLNSADISFDSGGAGVFFHGTVQDSNSMSGTLGSGVAGTCPQGTWSLQRSPLVP
jgi:hypothetical protein